MKKEALGYHERNLDISKNTKDYSYEESVNLVAESMRLIDPEFSDIHMDLCSTGKIDVYPKSGKRGGAFCFYHKKQNPVYIMLNHTDKVRDVSTLAHEMGHAIHGTLAKKETEIKSENLNSNLVQMKTHYGAVSLGSNSSDRHQQRLKTNLSDSETLDSENPLKDLFKKNGYSTCWRI